MVLVLDTPSAVDLAKADGQPKLKPARRRWATDCGRPATHDGNRKGDGVADAHLQLFDVEGLPGLVIGEEQIPGFLQSMKPRDCSGGGTSNMTMSSS